MKKRIAILGSTGSIGTQALQVIADNPTLFEAYAITAYNNYQLLIAQSLIFKPKYAVIVNEEHYPDVKEALKGTGVTVLAGMESVCSVVAEPEVDMVLTAMVGYAGLRPTISAMEKGKTIALANKETMVVAGEIICDLQRRYGSRILPVDSEHSAIFQCLQGEQQNQVEKILLTASGGPFRTKDTDYLKTVTAADALKHPNWSMGAKITIDSASMMNKGFEVIEAKWLFGIDVDKIEVVVHPQSIIHSMVQFADGAIKAQLGTPDMKLPIQYALSYPERLPNTYGRVDFFELGSMTFEKPDLDKFRNLALAYQAIHKGGNAPCILNAANEVANAAFLQGKIGFLQMSHVIEYTLNAATFITRPTYEDYVASDAEARRIAGTCLASTSC
ncbi:MAG: 1-deoxy-D-xylulose-5-phosphate reductoisomerase [Paludibacteraceae bacterium]|nr:1-deoxy-D-xylulose-5-phosphate reductoisomerase [Paludibacteraceae bacterium]